MEGLSKNSTQNLKKEYLGLNDAIEKFKCFGTKDITRREVIATELERRGYEISDTSEVTFTRIKK